MSINNRWICLLLIFHFDNGRSQPLNGCSAEILRFSECLSRCNDSSSCQSQELSNFMIACMSGNTQNCTEPPQTTLSPPEPPQTTLTPPELPQTTLPPPGPPETTLSPETTPSRVKCGIENQVPPTGNRVPRIVNGTAVNVARKYSWQVGLKMTTNEGIYNCGGSIITNKHILTAAHCFEGSTKEGNCILKIPTKVYVTIGDHNQFAATDNLPDFVEPLLKKHVNIHPDYNCNAKDNDIAVIELEKSIDLEKYADDIHPICLPKDDSSTYNGKNATTIGWGSTIRYNRPLQPGLYGTPFSSSNVLQETQITVMKNSKCSTKFKKLRDTMICATSKEGFGKGDCQGDSGGPLFVKENIQNVQIGITSFGIGCAIEENPGGYTRVSKYLNWIKLQVGSETTYTTS